mmetsp:Transcript_43640/g.123650  ORF Transcript_43640/g.123650 Transcript_43640/m.123650 type:complete len:213 (+) Transcript_43640:255-893(+)
MKSSVTSTDVDFDSDDMSFIRTQMALDDEKRESLIKRSRDVLKLSKMSISMCLRGDTQNAQKNLDECLTILKQELIPVVAEIPALRSSVAFCLEEWAEAKILHSFLMHNRIPRLGDLEVLTYEEYLGGLLDFTGELNRYAVLQATARHETDVKRCQDLCTRVQEEMMQFDLRNSNIRRKYDTLKYTVKVTRCSCMALLRLDGLICLLPCLEA